MLPPNNTETIGFLITDVARLLRSEFDRRTSDAGMGLTPGEARALSAVARAGLVRQAALAEKMGIEAMTLTSYFDRLEARGLVTRTVDPSDRRAKLVGATEEARPVLDGIAKVAEGIRVEMAAGLPPEKVEELRHLLRVFRSNLVDMRPDCSKGSTNS